MDKKDNIQQVYEQIESNSQLIAQLLEKISMLEQKVSDTTKELENVIEKQEMFTMHFNQIYSARSIEETLGIMSELGKNDMEVESCDVYSYDNLEDMLFTVGDEGDRVYTSIDESTPLSQALNSSEIFIDNNYAGESIGDNKAHESINNVAVIPIEAKNQEVIGVVVAKNKPDEFSLEDVEKFNLRKGKIGSAFRLGLENKALKQAAVTDKLTHLHNRQGALDHLKGSVLPSLKKGEPISVIMLDIDKFKVFNDTYGHDAGDKVLRCIADTLRANTSEADGVFRWGGEEMVVITNNCGADAFELAEKLRSTIENTPCDIGGGKTVKVTASMGVAQVTADSPEMLNNSNIMDHFEATALKKADEHLYQAKENGRNQVAASDEIMKTAAENKIRRKMNLRDL